jgi:hypothetical protein
MADVYSTVGVNARKFRINTSDAGRELVIKFAKDDMTDADLYKFYNNITQSGGVAGVLPANTGDAFTVAGFGTADGSAFVSGTTDVVFFRVQGTGTFSTVDAAGDTGATVTVEAVFQPAL